MREALAAVKAQIRDDGALKAELWEIAENLHRCDLTKEQRDEHIRRYAELITSENTQAGTFSKVGAGAGNKSIAGIIAAETGLDKRTVKRALQSRIAKAPRKSVE